MARNKKKRNFKKTQVPASKSFQKKSTKEIFVVHEHHAGHLHWDFRLELGGVLKSWAVPKGPSMHPKEKRLAVQTEDHPLEYQTFEGTIPQGEYGGGEVFIWDQGTWEPLAETGDPMEALEKGRMKFLLHGKKLKGVFVLVRAKLRGSTSNKNWLLIKNKSAQDISLRRAISSPDKIIYKKERKTKQDVANFYSTIAPVMLPYLKDRPLSLVRCPHGSEGTCFFQKHFTGKIPDSLHTFSIEEEGGPGMYLSINSPEGLLELVQLNTLEIHSWNCHKDDYMSPDQIVMDFDPGPGVPWNEVVDAAFELKQILDDREIQSFVKLTGGKGLHVHIPVIPLYDWDEIKAFSHSLAQELVARNPKRYIANMSKKFRENKIFVDYLRNGFGATAVVPYSLRARPLSALALPVEWSELYKIKDPQQFTMSKALRKIKSRKRDPWKGMLKLKQRMNILRPVNSKKSA
jgi:bifunctional non-homologous end joining protein LigD